MYLRAGLISLLLLVLSRVLGLGRESVQAAMFGTTGVADLVVAMLTLPDLLSSALATGALAYVLLPWWAGQTAQQVERSQRQVGRGLLALGVVLAMVMWVAAPLCAQVLVPASASDEALFGWTTQAVRWAAVAMPLALLSFLGYTRCQHERDAVGMYGMNVVHTGVLIAAMLAAATFAPARVVMSVGVGMLAAYALRLAFLAWRLRTTLAPSGNKAPAQSPGGITERPLPKASLWLWALLAAGLPAVLPIMARSMASAQASGALAIFNYAYKLVELPNLLAIQLVATLVFPALTRAYASGLDITSRLQLAWGLSWTLACAAVVALVLGAQPLGTLLFGWGKMPDDSLHTLARWAALGAWTLLPQSVLSVLMLVLATLGRLHTAAWAYGAAVAVLLGARYALDATGMGVGALGADRGAAMMLALSAALWAAVAVAASSVWDQFKAAFAWQIWLAPLLLCIVFTVVFTAVFDQWAGQGAASYGSHRDVLSSLVSLAAAGLVALCLVGISMWINPSLRSVLKR